jgi:predicted ATPase
MLKRLHLRNFTVFADAEFEFGEGLNVLVGANGTGKTHVLKAGYSILSTLLFAIDNNMTYSAGQQDYLLMLAMSNTKLIKVFQTAPSSVKQLIRHNSVNEKAELIISLSHPNGNVDAQTVITSTHQKAHATVSLNRDESTVGTTEPIFIPPKEVLTMGWLPPLYERGEISIDETYPDLLRLLFGPLRQPEHAHIIEKLAQLIGGKVEEEGGHFYLTAPDQPRLEMNLVAEGMRKFATLYKLLANGTLTPETTLFWDEPEANLNPVLLKELAAVLTDLAQAGFQIILATHSLFLMKELHILSRQRKQLVRYFGLYAGEKGDVQVEKQDDFMQLQHIAALDAELTQTFDFDEVLDQDYASDS